MDPTMRYVYVVWKQVWERVQCTDGNFSEGETKRQDKLLNGPILSEGVGSDLVILFDDDTAFNLYQIVNLFLIRVI